MICLQTPHQTATFHNWKIRNESILDSSSFFLRIWKSWDIYDLSNSSRPASWRQDYKWLFPTLEIFTKSHHLLYFLAWISFNSFLFYLIAFTNSWLTIKLLISCSLMNHFNSFPSILHHALNLLPRVNCFNSWSFFLYLMIDCFQLSLRIRQMPLYLFAWWMFQLIILFTCLDQLSIDHQTLNLFLLHESLVSIIFLHH